ncbi:MAG: hypothetical protein RLZZ622_455 [Planctomycetota bacterium]
MRTATIFLVLVAVSGAADAAGVPNVVWIIADDMSPDTAAYGVSGVSTPNLDRLAHEGRRFDHCYATAPVCSSSRSAFILGCYQTTTGLYPHDVENPQPLAAPYVPLPTLLRQAGWYVTNAAAPGSQRSGRAIRRGKTHYNFAHDSQELFDGDDWRQRMPGQPFFAQYQIMEPHRPFPIPESFSTAELDAVELPGNYPDHPLTRRDWVAYRRSVETVDQRVGEILNALEAEGVLDNTVVMFFGDHGRPMPWGKQWLSVEGLRVPLLVRGPGVSVGVEQGVVSLVDLAPTVLALSGRAIPDWMEGELILGRPLLADRAVFAARDRCGDAMDCSRTVITASAMLVKNYFPERSRLNWSSYKESAYPGLPLIRLLADRGQLTPLQAAWLGSPRAAVELYDLRSDPAGLLDVADKPARADEVKRLAAKLDQWIESTGDRGSDGDPVTEPPLEAIQQRKRASYGRVWKQRLGTENPTDMERVGWWLQEYQLDETAMEPLTSWKYPPDMPGSRVETYRRVGEADLRLWIFEPEGHQSADRRPAIIFFFGGGWRAGTPGQFLPQCRHLAARGMVAIAADYRVLSRQEAAPQDCLTDAKAAVRWVRANAERLGVDPQRIAVGGGSAGGHLAAAVATVPGFEEGEQLQASSRPDALVLFNPATVLAAVASHPDLIPAEKLEAIKDRAGGRPEAISPYHHLQEGLPPTIIFHGTDDEAVPFATAELFTAKMHELGNCCELKVFEGQPHGFFNPGRGTGPQRAEATRRYHETMRQLDGFLDSLGYTSALPTSEAARPPR